MTQSVAPEHRLRLCVIGDLDGVHSHSWVRYFVRRGHDVRGISYYRPSRPPEGVQVHALRSGEAGGALARARLGVASRLGRSLPPSLQRLAYLVRYRYAGLARAVAEMSPDLVHAHYIVEHGLYGTSAGFHPYVVTAWGSDVLVDAVRSPLNRAIARYTLSRADLATANNRHMAREMVVRLGKERARVQHVVLGVDRDFLPAHGSSVNERPREPERDPVLLSARSLDSPLYNVDVVLRAFAGARRRVSNAQLVVAGQGRLRPRLEALGQRLGLGDAVRFAGQLSQEALRDAMLGAEAFVSVPSSDATSVSVLQAMACGSFPIVSDIASQEELVENNVNGLRVPVRDVDALSEAIARAIEDPKSRRDAVARNRQFVEEYGLLESNMARMEAWYYRLAGRAGEAAVERAPDP